ncbi:ATPase, F1/V1/A1 complex, alpha/beta subunit, Zinc knuckle CX2CX4HX4C [Artemisia annua]|uniref:ATPase, F1/V1/A1 complex, alpha/beta subunit, Zinc knuckle CX2CX4HX4C n=1 Tax=Artemisia annua TaxID=35608 RepID=A0A2U1NZT7_ARTAN|nr:ATPase, F1/V1/A1 complex, alpha/beta subunit, Zinc knuckle CX2CX4HX4C [Artemisia annua]
MEESRKWMLTLCGHFVGCKMSYYELKYNISRMWGRFGLKDIVAKNGLYLFKFRESEGMNHVLESGPWLVNNKPLMVQKWDSSVIIDRRDPEVLACWIKLHNVPVEAWTVKGISAIASSLGNPLIMDKVTAKMYSEGTGNIGFARVLVEIKADREFKEKIEICYKGNNGQLIKKTLSLWMWSIAGSLQDAVIANVGTPKNSWKVDKNAIEELKRSANKYAVLEEIDESEVYGAKWKDSIDKYVKYQRHPSKEEAKLWTDDMHKYFAEQWKEIWDKECSEEEDVLKEDNGISNSMTVNELNGNVLDLLHKAMNNEMKMAVWNVRGMCNKEMQKDVKKFIRNANLHICATIETHVKEKQIGSVCKFVFGDWSWCSNVKESDRGCRIIVGWNEDHVNLVQMHSTRQAMLCCIEFKDCKSKFYCVLSMLQTLIWNDFKKRIDKETLPNRWEDVIQYMIKLKCNQSINSILRRIGLAACVYFIWNERNRRIFGNEKRVVDELIKTIVNHLRLKLSSLHVKKSAQVKKKPPGCPLSFPHFGLSAIPRVKAGLEPMTKIGSRIGSSEQTPKFRKRTLWGRDNTRATTRIQVRVIQTQHQT